jgi:hypothetical protein
VIATVIAVMAEVIVVMNAGTVVAAVVVASCIG